MCAKIIKPSTDANTESKIKAAARTIFHKKGFAATRTRDIAEEASINLALVNYYFRSKKKLFELIMLETLTGFFQNMAIVFNDETTSLHKKLELVTDNYIDLMLSEPEIPLFIMSEMKAHGSELLEKLPVAKTIMQSAFIRQYIEAVHAGRVTEPNPLHFFMNLTGMVIFPFINSPMFKKVGQLKDRQFNQMMQERKKLIPVWLSAMLKAK